MRRIALPITGMLVLGSGVAMQATGADAAGTQELLNVAEPHHAAVARWTKQPDSYVLQVLLGYARPAAPPAGQVINADLAPSISPEEMERLGIVNVADALAALVPQPGTMPTIQPRTIEARCSPPPDRGAAFICNTVTNLRGVTPADLCSSRPMTIDGQPAISALNQPWPPARKEGRVDVWLLKADGSQILPSAYSCESRFGGSTEILYRFPADASAQAVAAAIRIDNEFHVGGIRTE